MNKVIFRVCICGYHAWYRKRMIATISKHGSTRWEVDDANSLPVSVLTKVQMFAEDIARNASA